MFAAGKYLPKFEGTTYRAIEKPLTKLSSQYVPGGKVLWVPFTSTTKDLNVMRQFAYQQTGTWMILHGTQGIDITFSLFPSEQEVLFFPNSEFSISSILTDKMKLAARWNSMLNNKWIPS